jgi:hypothetical protein
MRAAYAVKRPGQEFSDSELATAYNAFNKARMCPICETRDHLTKYCPYLPSEDEQQYEEDQYEEQYEEEQPNEEPQDDLE